VQPNVAKSSLVQCELRLRLLAPPAILVDRGHLLTDLVCEVDDFLMGESKVQATLTRIARCLDELGIDFALAGGLAVGVRGYVRVTVDVDLLVTADGLAQ
jgi:hypothetical protein